MKQLESIDICIYDDYITFDLDIEQELLYEYPELFLFKPNLTITTDEFNIIVHGDKTELYNLLLNLTENINLTLM